MKARLSNCLLFLACMTLVGCQEEPEEPKPEPKPKKVTAKTWEPDDPVQVAGKAVYEQTCALCHDEGEESAPRLNNKKQWDPRREKGIETLIKHAIE